MADIAGPEGALRQPNRREQAQGVISEVFRVVKQRLDSKLQRRLEESQVHIPPPEINSSAGDTEGHQPVGYSRPHPTSSAYHEGAPPIAPIREELSDREPDLSADRRANHQVIVDLVRQLKVGLFDEDAYPHLLEYLQTDNSPEAGQIRDILKILNGSEQNVGYRPNRASAAPTGESNNRPRPTETNTDLPYHLKKADEKRRNIEGEIGLYREKHARVQELIERSHKSVSERLELIGLKTQEWGHKEVSLGARKITIITALSLACLESSALTLGGIAVGSDSVMKGLFLIGETLVLTTSLFSLKYVIDPGRRSVIVTALGEKIEGFAKRFQGSLGQSIDRANHPNEPVEGSSSTVSGNTQGQQSPDHENAADVVVASFDIPPWQNNSI